MKKYCIIGKSLKHSISPYLHGLMNADYKKVEIMENDLERFVLGCEFDGFNVTVPYKKQIMPFLDEISDEAKSIGAVNTVVKRRGRLIGFNTDFGGLAYSLSMSKIGLDGRNILVLGTGGTSDTAEAVCKKSGYKSINKVGRTNSINYTNVYEFQNTEILINTTPLGMFPNIQDCPLDVSRFKNLKGVFDVVYNPLSTKLVLDSKKQKINSANGLRMLVEQARLAENIFNDDECAFPIEKTEEILKKIYGEMKNVVLIGMPGSGKSTLGKMVANALKKRFVDLDEEIEKKAQMPIAEIFERFGEGHFRQLETEIIQENATKFGLVLATGGGAVTSPSFEMLRQNGMIIYVKRDLKRLDVTKRPLSLKMGVDVIYESRKALYETADFSVDNNLAIDNTLREIIKYYEENIDY